MKYTIPKLLFAAAVVVAIVMPASAHAAGTPVATATIDSQDPLKSIVVLKNTGKDPCQVVNSATGTIAISRVVQDDADITPTPMDVSFEDGLESMLRSQLKTLQPGESLKIPLRASMSDKMVGLRPVVWSADSGTLGMLYMVKPDRPIQLELTYIVPIDSPTDVPMCTVAQASTIKDDGGMAYIIGGILVLLAVGVGIGVWWFIRRKKQPKEPVVAALVVVVGLAALFGPSQPANAQVVVPDSVRGAWDSCVSTLRANEDITGPILDLIDSTTVRIIIDPVESGGTEASSPWPDGSYHINWDYNDRHRYVGGGGTADPCTSIYHELYHILDMQNRTFSRDDCAGSGIETKEVMATRAQNLLRARLGMPERTHYGDRPLPMGDCRAAPTPPPCRTTTCGRSIGEPHLVTFDGHRYDFQAAGEFVLTRAKEGQFEVQVRQQQWENSRWVAINTAATVKTARHTIQVASAGYKLALIVDGKEQSLATAELADGDTLTVNAATRVNITSKEGDAVTVQALGNYGIDVSVDPSEALKGKTEGLLGNFDGDAKNDLRLSGKDNAIQPDFEQLYPAFADSWRLTDQSSHFTYSEGKNTASYTNRAFPYERFDPKKLASFTTAEELCKQFGVTDATSLANCAMDVALTGRPEFARSAVRHQAATNLGANDATLFTLTTKQSDDVAKAAFTGKKDEKVFVDAYAGTFPSACGALTLRNAEDRVVSDGCIINGKGYIETTTLPADGTYTLQLKASEAAVGDVRARLYRVTDQTGGITVDGDAVTADITKPGMQSRFTFNASTGQRLFVTASDATLSSQCSPLSILDPAGRTVSNGCIINGKGVIDTVIAADNGQYTLLVDPVDVSTGKLTLKLNTSQLTAKSVVAGETVALRFAKPGDEAELRYTGTAGRRIRVDVSSSTLPSQCGGFSMKMPNGQKVDGCIIGKDGNLSETGIVLPVSGVYVITINPAEDNTGELSIQIR